MGKLLTVVVVVLVAGALYTQFMPMSKDSDMDSMAATEGRGSAVKPTLGFIDDERIKNAESEPGNWLAFGRTYEEQRHSPLTQINKDSVSNLGLTWFKDMGTNRAQESTPIVVDGIMFLTSSWSRVFAIDAVTGETKFYLAHNNVL